MAELPPFNSLPPEPEVAPIGESLSPPPPPREKKSPSGKWQGIKTTFAWILRWALLGVGVGGVWFLGVLVAQFFPAAEPQPPWQEVVVRRTNRVVQKVRRLPAWWTSDAPQGSRSVGISRLPSVPAAPAPVVRPITLAEEEREQITIELESVEATLQQLRDRTSALETRLGLPDIDKPLEERLADVSSRLSPPAAQEAPPPSPTSVVQPIIPPPDPLFQVNAYRVTLPGDLLFTPGETFLQTDAFPLLDNILLDVGRYPGATVLVGSYTDQPVGDLTPTEVSYKQALAVQQYLSQRLGDDSYHWVGVGYGNTSLGVTGATQLSRRLIIAIVP